MTHEQYAPHRRRRGNCEAGFVVSSSLSTRHLFGSSSSGGCVCYTLVVTLVIMGVGGDPDGAGSSNSGLADLELLLDHRTSEVRFLIACLVTPSQGKCSALPRDAVASHPWNKPATKADRHHQNQVQKIAQREGGVADSIDENEKRVPKESWVSKHNQPGATAPTPRSPCAATRTPRDGRNEPPGCFGVGLGGIHKTSTATNSPWRRATAAPGRCSAS